MGTSVQVSELSLFPKDEDPIFRDLTFSVPEKVIANIALQDREKIDSLLNILIGEENPDRGQVLVAGRNVVRSSRKNLMEMRKKDIGFIPRNFKLPFRTVLETLDFKMKSLGTPFDTENKIEETLNFLGLSGKENRQNSELTQLERVKVAVALAVVNRPQLLISNQIFRQLDKPSRDQILEIMENLCEQQNMTVLIATENPLKEDNVTQIDLSSSPGSDSI